MSESDNYSGDTERTTVELQYAVCRDCDWYELCGTDDVLAESLAHEHRGWKDHYAIADSEQVGL